MTLSFGGSYSACQCRAWMLEAQPYMERLHALVSEVVPDVRLAELPCGHIGIGTLVDMTEAHMAAIDRASELLGIQAPSGENYAAHSYKVIR